VKLFQKIIIPGYVEGLDHDFKIQTCIIVDPPLEEIIQGKLFQKNYSIT
jgi:hypothetical protein